MNHNDFTSKKKTPISQCINKLIKNYNIEQINTNSNRSSFLNFYKIENEYLNISWFASIPKTKKITNRYNEVEALRVLEGLHSPKFINYFENFDCLIMQYIKGKSLLRLLNYKKHKLNLLKNILSKIYELTECLNSSDKFMHLDKINSNYIKQYNLIIKKIEYYGVKINRFSTEIKFTKHIIKGDAGAGNVIIDKNHIYFIDFESIGIGSKLYDFIRLVSSTKTGLSGEDIKKLFEYYIKISNMYNNDTIEDEFWILFHIINSIRFLELSSINKEKNLIYRKNWFQYIYQNCTNLLIKEHAKIMYNEFEIIQEIYSRLNLST